MTLPHPENTYLSLLNTILKRPIRADRTGTGVLSLFAPQPLVFTLNRFPLLTTKKMSLRLIAEELFWFLKGETDGTKLLEKKVGIWEGNGNKQFLEARGINRREHDLGKQTWSESTIRLTIVKLHGLDQ
jgi:thymidylate synthase